MTYISPVEDIAFALEEIVGINQLSEQGAYPDYEADLLRPVLEEAGKLATNVLAPLNAQGNVSGCVLTPDGVVSAPGFKAAYQAFRDGGWMGLSVPTDYGGQGLPRSLALGVMEMMHGANMAFSLCPMLSFGAIEALLAHGSEHQKQTYLPKLVSGEWTGTMNLTEPQAGSDVGALKTKAVPSGDGAYALTGQKIYITWGDHDLADNIIHLVLARLPDAPAGSAGISLFLCPKFLLDENGHPGQRNGVTCIGLEKKLGIHASPTCVMEYDGAKAWLIGAPHRGLTAMFTMMNSARLNVGLEGVGVGEAACQAALAYAQERKQGRAPGIEGPAPILHHADVRRTLITMQAKVQAARAICLACGIAADQAQTAGTETDRETARLREELLTPIAKAWSTDVGVETASLGVQIHGGMGFMNETLAAQLYRDARIAPIYEGTNGIQAIDLAGRKLAMKDGAAMQNMLEDIQVTIRQARETNDPQLGQIADRLSSACETLRDCTDWMRQTMTEDRETGLASATAYLRLAGDVIGGHFLALSALRGRRVGGIRRARTLALAGFYAETLLAEAPGRAAGIKEGGAAVLRDSEALFDLS